MLGDAYEDARLKLKNPEGQQAGPSKKNNKAKASAKPTKRKKPDDEEEDNGASKSPKKPKSERHGDRSVLAEEDDEADEGVKAEVKVLLAVKWDLEKGDDPTGWWVSEKLDGVR